MLKLGESETKKKKSVVIMGETFGHTDNNSIH